MTPAQRRMLQLVGDFGPCDLVEAYREVDDTNINYALAWRNADRTANALCKRGWITIDGAGVVEITEAGKTALQKSNQR